MSSGLLALLDDVALIAKTAAASVDDVAGMTAKAGTKAAGVVIDDAAVTPRYVMGFSPARELPIVWKIARGSFFNKLVLILPAALILSQFAPWAITPVLMCGGLFLCFEGAEKVLELVHPHKEDASAPAAAPKGGADLERVRVRSAIQTDLILSAEIMAIALSSLPESPLWEQAVVLAVVGVAITAGVYGAVALIVKADDIGLALAENSGSGPMRGFGRWLVRAMPWVLFALSKIGMVAMLWVGGGILLHGAEELGLHAPADWVHHLQEVAGHALPVLGWLAAAAVSALLGLAVGFLLLPLGHLAMRLRGGH
ncbi:DUF808 domain-containing protein [Mangrovicoccus algicola]|uniref:DUF808 domain-containing protein n=1 Tax=Mangrovicoccus algicola TaxID=2771008 RepID=A0A8J6YZN2_9RHOB|nr:DUF808 domain-containing protein [Mangrovicoccus algicola]MBE3638916.1 DUF808 domain-containing protein [Mangrovicoccus algicola]